MGEADAGWAVWVLAVAAWALVGEGKVLGEAAAGEAVAALAAADWALGAEGKALGEVAAGEEAEEEGGTSAAVEEATLGVAEEETLGVAGTTSVVVGNELRGSPASGACSRRSEAGHAAQNLCACQHAGSCTHPTCCWTVEGRGQWRYSWAEAAGGLEAVTAWVAAKA